MKKKKEPAQFGGVTIICEPGIDVKVEERIRDGKRVYEVRVARQVERKWFQTWQTRA